MPRPLLLLLGDSITEFGSDWQNGGWVSLLLQRFTRSADIAQRGMSGYSAQWFMDLVVPTLSDDLSTTLRPHFITLWLGANDAALLDGPAADQHVPLDRFKTNLHAMVALFKAKAPQAKVLLLTPPPVDDDERRRRNGGLLDRSNAASGEYARACVAVGQEAGVDVLDVYTLFQTRRPGQAWKALLDDGLHLSIAGNQFVEQLITSAIAVKFPALQAQLDQVEFPMWVSTPRRAVAFEETREQLTGSLDLRRAMATEADKATTATVDATRVLGGGGTNDALGGLFLPMLLVCGALLAVVARRVQRKSGVRKVLMMRAGLQEGECLLATPST